MKTVFDNSARAEFIDRINSLSEQSVAQWGKMNVNQITRHCTLWNEMILRNKKYKRVFIGRLLGKVLLRNELKDEQPMRQNNPTIPELIIKNTDIQLEAEKNKWISQINEFGQYSISDSSFIHPFFGTMTKEQIGQHVYKHTDHHLRQFNC